MTPEQIAAGLSEAMKQALLRLAKDFCWADGRSVKALVRRGLVGFAGPDPLLGALASIKPEGLEVASVLEQEHEAK